MKTSDPAGAASASALIDQRIADLGDWRGDAKGASLKDPSKLFNASLDGNARRAIDIGEGEEVDAKAFKALVRAAIELNASGKKAGVKRTK